ncbi:MAG: right-handed parallel beta-helix repeat-containing protein [Cyanobacteria bacterium J06634_5]
MKTRFCQTQSRIQKHLKLGLSYCLSLASVLAISAEAMAMPIAPDASLLEGDAAIAQNQTDQTQVAQSTTPETTSTEALRLRPSYNINFTEGAGHDGFGSVGGFFPLFQTPGENVTFIDGRVSVDTDGDFGGGLQAGYRSLLNDSTIWGAFAGLDVRDTGDFTFTQANVGTELLGDNWDVTLNANLPLGDSRQVISSETQARNLEFSGNQLFIDEQQVDQVQAALTTVSLDSGLELFDFGSGSSLWGRGGVYFLGGEASEDSLGFRASLDYRPKNNLRVGVGVQNDGIFDTNVIFSFNASLGSSSRRAYDEEENGTEANPVEERSQLWARAAEPIARTNTVLVEERTDVEILQADVAAINPETGNAFVFRHVDPDLNTGIVGLQAEPVGLQAALAEATFENPVATIASAANIADANADNIIFVQEGNAGGGFTLPDGVEVRSVGPVQPLNTQFGEVILPGSGSGNLPTVTGQVTIGNNTLVSGLEINPTKFENGFENGIENGIEAVLATEAAEIINGIEVSGENITLTDNVIANVDRGINLPDIDGNVTIARNQISNTSDDGIFFGGLEGEDNATVIVTDNALDATGAAGIEFGLIEGDAIANITVANNQITDAQLDNIFFDDIEQNAVATIAVEENIINAENVDAQIAGGDGIEFDNIENNANATITVNNNQISNVAFEGIEFGDVENDAVATINVENNQIISGETGIEFDNIENRANANITIAGNMITVANEEGILFDDIENNTVSNITIANNNILGAATEGIEFDVIEDNANATINIAGNQISNVGEEGIFFNDIQETATAVITVDSNTITDAGDDGIEFALIENDANVTATVTNNTIINPGIQDTLTTNPADFLSIVIDPPNTTDDEPDDDEPDEDELEELEASINVVANVIAAEEATATPEPVGDGVRITHTADADMCLALDNNTVINPASDGFDLISNGAGQFQVVDLANVTSRNVGTFNPADIETNDGFVNGTAGEQPCL